VCVGVRKSRYGVFRDYSGSFVCDEFGQRGRSKILHDSPVLLDAFKKNQRETRLRNESKPNEGDRKYYSGPGYRGTRYPGRTFCFEICDPLSHMSVFHCICNFLSNVSPNTLPGGAR